LSRKSIESHGENSTGKYGLSTTHSNATSAMSISHYPTIVSAILQKLKELTTLLKVDLKEAVPNLNR
jgi:hypothetical protein